MPSVPSIADEVERYLRTGETDPHYAAWPGDGFMERANRAHEDVRGALVREVRRLASLLGDDAPRLAGLSEEATCYVSPDYFAEDDPFADFIVHEAAHIFHNCKRATVGLRETRRKEWLLDIEYRKRETFAYSCEAYARVLERAKSPSERRALAAAYGERVRISEERVDPAEVAAIVAEAASARSGWKVILARCTPTSRPKSALQQLRASWAAEDAARRQ